MIFTYSLNHPLISFINIFVVFVNYSIELSILYHNFFRPGEKLELRLQFHSLFVHLIIMTKLYLFG